MTALVKPIPLWVDVVRAKIAARQEEIKLLETTRPLYEIVAREIGRHCGLTNPSIDIVGSSIHVTIWCLPDEPALPMIRGIAADITEALTRAKLRDKRIGPSVASEEQSTGMIHLFWAVAGGDCVAVWFFVPSAVPDLALSQSIRITRETRFTARPRDGSSILPGIEPDIDF